MSAATCHFVIPAAGKGLRFGAETPKQYLSLLGKPVLVHTIEALAPFAETIVVAIGRDDETRWQLLEKNFPLLQRCKVIEGGATRFESVQKALGLLQGSGLVAIHDAVRPLIAEETLHRLIVTAEKEGAAIPYHPLSDSLRMLTAAEAAGQASVAVERAKYVAVQTPQIFRMELLQAAYATSHQPAFTDDCAVYEYATKKSPALVEDPYPNIKITHSQDLAIAELLLLQKKRGY